MDDKQKITQLKQNLNEAIRKKNIAAAISLFSKRSTMFMLPPPLRFVTEETAVGEKNLGQWFSSFKDEIGLEYRELEIYTGQDVAFCHCLERLTGNRTDGTSTDIWYRETLGLEKIAGTWKISHQHQSVPMTMDGSRKAAVDLKP